MVELSMFLEKLESSTIHGLAHISTSRRKLVRIFWIIVVITAMGIAGINILYYWLKWHNYKILDSFI